MARIAIMQPYFIPYAGYFRLLCDVDVFVALDCVQYTKGSWINRNKLTTFAGGLEWFNAPFARAPLGTRIDALDMLPNAAAQIARRGSRFPACADPSDTARPVVERIMAPTSRPSDYLVDTLRATADTLGLSTPIVRASTLPIDEDLRGVERVYAICEHLKATVYYNASGGASLYSADDFARRGMELRLHPPYRGSYASILQRLHEEPAHEVRAEIEANMS